MTDIQPDWSKLPPHRPCYAYFDGMRQCGRYVEVINEPVEVIELEVGRRKELAVAMLGRATKWPIGLFEGRWQVLEVTP
ncbi:MAG: hypothetical protein DMF06_03300 [Verrucomicrobia bacterium]|nr:MAG: hypothetical protein DMF06_03300 [Verrucomicrobiota bacterium]